MAPVEPQPVGEDKLARRCSDALARAMLDFCANFQSHRDDRFEALAARLQAPLLNMSVRSPKRPLQQQCGAASGPVAIAAVGAGPPLPDTFQRVHGLYLHESVDGNGGGEGLNCVSFNLYG